MNEIVLPFLSLLLAVANLWRKEWRVAISILLVLIAAATGLKEWRKTNADAAREDTRQRLTAELLSGYHKLESLVLIFDLMTDPDGRGHDDALGFFPIAGDLAATSWTTELKVSLGRQTATIAITPGDEGGWWKVRMGDVEQSMQAPVGTLEFGSYVVQVENIAPGYAFVVSVPVDGAQTSEKLTLPRALAFLAKNLTVGSLTFGTDRRLTQAEIGEFREAFERHLAILFKAYVTDNDPAPEPQDDADHPADDADQPAEESEESNEWSDMRPHLFFPLALSNGTAGPTSVRFDLVVEDHPHLHFTEEYPW